MKPSNIVPTVIISAVLVVAGCSSSDTPKAASGSSTSSTSAGTKASTSTSSSSAAATSTTAAGASLATATNSSVGKPILVDGAGRTVYFYEPDGTNTTSQVPAGIRSSWPALTASAAPTAGTGADASKIGVQAQPDGTKQVTYNGHLLYTFIGDSAPGDANGQGLGGIWFTLSPAGDKNA